MVTTCAALAVCNSNVEIFLPEAASYPRLVLRTQEAHFMKKDVWLRITPTNFKNLVTKKASN